MHGGAQVRLPLQRATVTSLVLLSLLAGIKSEPNQTSPGALGGPRPRIYIYPEVEELVRHSGRPVIQGNFYGLDFIWYEQLKESPYVEKDPEKADYFYMPSYGYWGNPRVWPDRMAEIIKKAGPWFDRKNGSDHIFTWPGDFGRCEWGNWGVLKHTILLHHYGKVFNDREPATTPCNLLKTWGDKCDHLIGSMKTFMEQGEDGYNPCHYMDQDIVVPPTFAEFPDRSRYLNPQLDANRTDLAFFAGPVNLHDKLSHDYDPDAPWSDAWYSFGSRQTFIKVFQNVSGFKLHEKHIPDYLGELSRSNFCLAAAGWGWGGRMKFSVMAGCIPVIVQDGVRVEWEEQLPMHEYALRIPMWYMHKLPQTLQALIRKGVAKKMHKALECVWRFHWWGMPHGRAFDLVICELKKRLLDPDGKINVDTNLCTMQCGDDEIINITTGKSVVQ